MTDRLRPMVAPAYLFLALVLGGSAQGVWGNALLQILAIAIISWALIEDRDERLARPARQLLAIVGGAVLLVLLQLVPLPASVWSSLPGRELVANGFATLGLATGAMPLSLSPYDSIRTLLGLLPALGMLAALLCLRAYSATLLAAALTGGTALGVLLGIVQVSAADPAASPWYLYRQSNFGVATGFFANGNHMAALLLTAIPFVAALGVTARERANDARVRMVLLVLVGGGLVLITLGLLLNGSLAGYGLAVPVVLASVALLLGVRRRLARLSVLAVIAAGVIALALLWASPVSRQADPLGATGSVTTRQSIMTHSLELVDQFGLVGTGLGTFEKAYPLTEDPAGVDRVHVNHVHNDYVELAIETGLPGIVLTILFLAWWFAAVVQMARSPASDQFAFAGAIASAALLLHSLVDYPLRTAALSTLFAMCLALILQSRRVARSEGDLRPTRHLVVG